VRYEADYLHGHTRPPRSEAPLEPRVVSGPNLQLQQLKDDQLVCVPPKVAGNRKDCQGTCGGYDIIFDGSKGVQKIRYFD